MARKIKINAEGFASAVFDVLTDYQSEVTGETADIVQKVGEQTVRNVRTNIETAGIGGTKYKNSIQIKLTRKRLYSEAVVYSPKHYQLTHLLENGHALVLWGHRTNRRTQAKPHWEKAEADAIRDIEKEIEKAVKA